MSNWADLLGDDETGVPAPEPEPEPGPTPEPESGAVECWRLDGPEPPPHVVRLAPTNPGARRHLARKPLTDDGEPQGWWYVDPYEDANTGEPGWAWANRGGNTFVQEFPVLTDLEDDFTCGLALALPRDGQWYRIGTSPGGRHILAWCTGPDEWDARAVGPGDFGRRT